MVIHTYTGQTSYSAQSELKEKVDGTKRKNCDTIRNQNTKNTYPSIHAHTHYRPVHRK